MFGREAVERQVLELFAKGARLVTLTGPGGVGKSTLARAVASALEEAPAILIASDEVLDLHENSIAEDGGLLVIDDADAVLERVSKLARTLLDGAAKKRLLVTSRETLGIQGEHVVAVGPLDVASAIALFEACSGDARRAPDEDVRALVERLEGIPLAIELAARRGRILSPRELLARGAEELRLLRGGRRDALPRHASMAAAIAFSYDLLSPNEKRAFEALGLFAPSFDLDAFEVVTAPLAFGDPIDHAETLLMKSLLTATSRGGAVRLSVLGLVSAFAREKLAGPDVRDGERRHAAHYLARAEQAAGEAYGDGADAALARLELELPNIIVALERAKAREDHPFVARLALALEDVALFRNAFDLHGPLFEDAVRAADRCGDPALRARTRIFAAKVTLEVGRAADAERTLVEALAIAEGAGENEIAARARRSLAWARIALGRGEDALADLERVLSFESGAGDARARADALAARGLVRSFQGAHDDARADLEEAFAIHQAQRDAPRERRLLELAELAGLPLVKGAASTDARRVALAASAQVHAASGRRWREALDLVRLADLLRAEGRSAEADEAEEAARSAASRAAVPVELARAVVRRARTPHGRRASWRVGDEARSLRPPQGAAIDLRRHGAVRRVLDALVRERLARPGHALSSDALLAAGWPGERLRHESGMLRVYTAVRRLRAMGMDAVLVTRDDGYLLDPSVPFEREAGV